MRWKDGRFCRPYVSDDNPYWESPFRTRKDRPEFPDLFGSVQDSRAFASWHRHSSRGLPSPAKLRPSLHNARLADSSGTLRSGPLPWEVWINKPPHSEKDTRQIMLLSVSNVLTRARLGKSDASGQPNMRLTGSQEHPSIL